MKVWIILGIVLVALVLLSLVRIGALVEYGQDGLLIRARVGVFRITLYPPKPKKAKREKKPKKEKNAPPEGEAPKKGGSFDLVKRCLPLVADAAGQMKRKIRIDTLYLDFTAAAGDPAAAAMAFGGANAAIGMIWPLFEQNFTVKDRRIRTAVDFQAKAPVIYLYLVAGLTIGQALTLGIGLLLRFLTIFFQYRAQRKRAQSDQKQKEAV